MANGKVVSPRRGEMLDRETGEPVQSWSNQHAHTTCRTNAETGEVERTQSFNIHSERRRPFQVPKKALHNYQLKHRTDHNHQMLELVNRFNDSNDISEYYYPVRIEQKFLNNIHISPVVFLLPTLFLFPFPAWFIVFSILIELCLHMWTHKTNKYSKDSCLRYQSPLHILSSQFCALCRSKRNMQRISRLQDARALKVYRRKHKYCTYVERVSVVT